MSIEEYHDKGERFIYNKAPNVSPAFDGKAKSSNWVVPNAEGVNYPKINGYLYYRDYTTNAFIEETTTAGTYNLVDKHQSVFSATKQLTQAELDQLNANPDLVFKLTDDDTFTLVDGFKQPDMQNLFLGNEGIRGGNLLFDIITNDAIYFNSTDTAQVYIMRMPIGTSVTINETEYAGNNNTDVVANISETGMIKIKESIDGCLTTFSCYSNQLTGVIPDLDNNTSLTTFSCYSNQLTGVIPDLDNNTSLIAFYCHNNQLTGAIPDLDNNTSLIAFYCHNNQLTGAIPDLDNNTSLTIFYCSSNQLTGVIPDLDNNTSLTIFSCYNNQLTGVIPDLDNNTSLTHFYCHNNQLTNFTGTSITISGTFNASNNALTQTAIDNILTALVTGSTANATITLDAGTNAVPSSAGESAIDTLRANGCTVTVTGGY